MGSAAFQRFMIRRSGVIGLALAGLWLLSIGGGIVLHRPPSGWWLGTLFCTIVACGALAQWARFQRQRVIRESALPQFLKRKLREAYPHLDGRDCDLVERGLRQFFLACLRSGRSFVAMPSKAVDAYWHEFILHTQAYAAWCDLTLGRFLHHTPAEALGPRASDNDGLRRAWYWSCREESIVPRRPTRLPLLFALDAKLRIEGGFRYVTDCTGLVARQGADGQGPVHCGTDFADGSFSGDAESMGGCETSGSGDGWGDGGGDGGGGDGGCGGGGD